MFLCRAIIVFCFSMLAMGISIFNKADLEIVLIYAPDTFSDINFCPCGEFKNICTYSGNIVSSVTRMICIDEDGITLSDSYKKTVERKLFESITLDIRSMSFFLRNMSFLKNVFSIEVNSFRSDKVLELIFFACTTKTPPSI